MLKLAAVSVEAGARRVGATLGLIFVFDLSVWPSTEL